MLHIAVLGAAALTMAEAAGRAIAAALVGIATAPIPAPMSAQAPMATIAAASPASLVAIGHMAAALACAAP